MGDRETAGPVRRLGQADRGSGTTGHLGNQAQEKPNNKEENNATSWCNSGGRSRGRRGDRAERSVSPPSHQPCHYPEPETRATGHVIAKFRPGDGYPQSLSLTTAGALSYEWSGTRSGIWIIPKATSPGSTPRRLIGPSAGVKGYHGAGNPEVTPDGSLVLTTLFKGSSEVIGEFSARTGKGLRLMTEPVRDPAQYCGPLWTDASGARLLLACGDAAEFEVSNGRLTKLPSPWKLPTYPVPGAPLIAW